eukprot:3832489-Rhodomonas_salina.1
MQNQRQMRTMMTRAGRGLQMQSGNWKESPRSSSILISDFRALRARECMMSHMCAPSRLVRVSYSCQWVSSAGTSSGCMIWLRNSIYLMI